MRMSPLVWVELGSKTYYSGWDDLGCITSPFSCIRSTIFKREMWHVRDVQRESHLCLRREGAFQRW